MPEVPAQAEDREGAVRAHPRKYTKLPPQIRREDMVTTQDVRPPHVEKGEHDRETEWMLRTTGMFI